MNKHKSQKDTGPLGDEQAVVAVPGAPNVFFLGSARELNGEPSFIARTDNISDPNAWSKMLPDSVYIYGFDFISPTVGFASGASNKVADKVQIGNSIYNRNYFYKWNGSVLSNLEILKYADLKISPNPAQDILKLDCESFENGRTAIVSVNNTVGQVVILKEIFEEKLNIAPLPAGFYFLKIETARKMAVGRFLKN